MSDKTIDRLTERAKHSAGPWNVYSEAPKYNVYSIWDRNDNFHPNVTQSTREANARLIAAAPELLDSLRILYEETADYIRINNLGDVHHNRSMQYARDVLAKAEGQP